MKQAAVGYACVVMSLALHAVALRQGTGEGIVRPRPLFVPLALALTPPEIPEAPPLAAPSPAPEPSPKLRPRPLPKAAPVPSEPEPEQQAAAEPPLTGTTLVAPGEASWAAAAGNGSERDGAIGSGASGVALAPKAPPAVVPAALPPPVTEPLARLSRKPVPPPLQLEHYYPPLARSQGKSGEAKVRALIEASGRVSHVQINFESEPGFGAACQKALQQSQWTGPLGASGEPTATFISYRCKFRVGD